VIEHRIRLRGGWECRTIEATPGDLERLTLPTHWPSGRRRLLTRRFGRPRLGPGSRVLLLMEQVPGIRSLLLNGQPAARASPEASRYEIPLGALPERNHLVLEIEPPRSTDPASLAAPGWGEIALLIRTPEPPDGH
jgi:hypothetical protein